MSYPWLNLMLLAMGDTHQFVGEIEIFYIAVKKLHATEKFSDGVNDVRDVEIAGGHLVEHRREQEEVFLVHQRDFGVQTSRERSFQLQRAIHPAKAAAKNDDLLLLF
jgi:hypothetical protein